MTRKPYVTLIQQAVSKMRREAGVWRHRATESPDWEELGEAFEHVYVTIENLGPDDPIVRAFDTCELDLDTPFHWEHLLRALCVIHFSPPKKREKTVRTEALYDNLERDIAQVREVHGDLNDTKLSDELVKLPHYSKLKSLTIRRMITDLNKTRGRKR